jgi:hypothetical protein
MSLKSRPCSRDVLSSTCCSSQVWSGLVSIQSLDRSFGVDRENMAPKIVPPRHLPSHRMQLYLSVKQLILLHVHHPGPRQMRLVVTVRAEALCLSAADLNIMISFWMRLIRPKSTRTMRSSFIDVARRPLGEKFQPTLHEELEHSTVNRKIAPNTAVFIGLFKVQVGLRPALSRAAMRLILNPSSCQNERGELKADFSPIQAYIRDTLCLVLTFGTQVQLFSASDVARDWSTFASYRRGLSPTSQSNDLACRRLPAKGVFSISSSL